MFERDRLFIAGEWVTADGADTISIVNPATEEICGHVPAGNANDVERAVMAARAAFPGWAATPVEQRGKFLARLHEALAARQEEVARAIATEMGTPLPVATAVQAGLPLAVLGSYVSLLPGYDFESVVGNSLVVREPVGVAAAITPWNYPLHQVMAKVAPALAAGCPIVLKPSALAPLSAFLLAEIAAEAELPPGVFNLVSGSGAVVGEALAAHPDVDVVSLTGSVAAGRRVAELAAATIKRVTLELGGKSANVFLPDLTDEQFTKAVESAAYNAFYNSGQTCTAWTRLLVPSQRQAEVLDALVEVTSRHVVGDPFDTTTTLGPLVSANQLSSVRGYIDRGIAEGARRVLGGSHPVPGRPVGYYIEPTIFADVTTGMTVAQEEIFGPVLCVLPYDDEDEAAAIANDSIFGLSGGVWSDDDDRGLAFARRMRTGQVAVNGGRYNVMAPFGGYKQSGNGRELGTFGLEEYLEVKSIQH
jgi:acyl-CoA reductase-like NAD-dependent aldehyde dehydrogenase